MMLEITEMELPLEIEIIEAPKLLEISIEIIELELPPLEIEVVEVQP